MVYSETTVYQLKTCSRPAQLTQYVSFLSLFPHPFCFTPKCGIGLSANTLALRCIKSGAVVRLSYRLYLLSIPSAEAIQPTQRFCCRVCSGRTCLWDFWSDNSIWTGFTERILRSYSTTWVKRVCSAFFTSYFQVQFLIRVLSLERRKLSNV